MTRSLRSSLDLVLVLLVCLALADPAGAREGIASPEDVRVKARAVLEEPGYQTSLPVDRPARGRDQAPEEEEVSQGSQGSPSLSGGQEEGASPVVLPVLGAASVLARLVVYVFVAVAVVLLLSWIVLALMSRRSGRRPEAGARTAVAAEDAEAPEREAILDDASRLAAEGRYGEAIHVLLLVAIQQLAARSRVTLPPSRTSREIVRLLPLMGESRETFSELVRSVELSLFGGVPAGREDYERSLARFQALVRRPA